MKQTIEFPAQQEAGAVQAHADGAGLKGKDAGHLLGVQLFHVVEDEDEAVAGREIGESLLEEAGILAAGCGGLGALTGVGEQCAQLFARGHEVGERDGAAMGGGATGLNAAIFGGGVEPCGKGLGIVEANEVRQGFEENFLGGVFGVLAMAADLDAKGEDGALEEFEGAGNALRVALAQDTDGIFEFSAQSEAPSQQLIHYRKGQRERRPCGTPVNIWGRFPALRLLRRVGCLPDLADVDAVGTELDRLQGRWVLRAGRDEESVQGAVGNAFGLEIEADGLRLRGEVAGDDDGFSGG